jgi:hypothetical protein
MIVQILETDYMANVNGNPFEFLKTCDGLGENEGVSEDVRDFIRALGVTYAGYGLFRGSDAPKRVGLVLDLLEDISKLQDGATLQLIFRPFQRDERGEIVNLGDAFVVKVERTAEPVPVGDAVAAGDPCCAWVWDPVRKVMVCARMC